MSPASHEAPQAQTAPLQRGGPRFASHRPVHGAARLHWRPSVRVWVQGALFALPALLVLLILLAAGEVRLHEPATWILPLITVFFIAMGALIVRRHRLPIVFDRQLGWFWRGHPRAPGSADIARLKEATRLAEIRAVQLVTGQQMRTPYATWDTWELNLILKNGQRLPVISHGNLKALRQDATTLANWLALPLVE